MNYRLFLLSTNKGIYLWVSTPGPKGGSFTDPLGYPTPWVLKRGHSLSRGLLWASLTIGILLRNLGTILGCTTLLGKVEENSNVNNVYHFY